jgi:hypothetical protein
VDLEDSHIGVIARQVGSLGERDAVELRGGAEDAVLKDPLRFEPRAQGGAIEIVLRRADTLGVVRPVVRLEREGRVRGIHDRLEGGLLDARIRRGREASRRRSACTASGDPAVSSLVT